MLKIFSHISLVGCCILMLAISSCTKDKGDDVLPIDPSDSVVSFDKDVHLQIEPQ